eukprot:XP_028345287.1 ATP-binding cassette sub-family A member 13 [Physeter catodon]
MLNRMGAGRLCSLGRVLANLTSCVLLTLFQGLTSATSLEATSQALMRKNSFLASNIFNSSLVGKNLSSESATPSYVQHPDQHFVQLEDGSGEKPFLEVPPSEPPSQWVQV